MVQNQSVIFFQGAEVWWKDKRFCAKFPKCANYGVAFPAIRMELVTKKVTIAFAPLIPSIAIFVPKNTMLKSSIQFAQDGANSKESKPVSIQDNAMEQDWKIFKLFFPQVIAARVNASALKRI